MIGGELLNHQLKVSRYLVARMKTQKGLLAIHGLGSGKTKTGIGLAQNYPRRKIMVLVPEGLDYVWETELKEMNIDRQYNFIYYPDLIYVMKENPNLFNDCVLLADEAHKIAMLFETMNKSDIVFLMNCFKKCFKILLLTGTPIYRNESDISWLINIVAGINVLPVNRHDFENRYYRVHVPTSIMKGYLQPLFASYIPLFIFIIYTMLFPLYTYGIHGIKMGELYAEDKDSFSTGMMMNNIDNGTSEGKKRKESAINILKDHYAKTDVPLEELMSDVKLNQNIIQQTKKLFRNVPKDFYISKIMEGANQIKHIIPGSEATQRVVLVYATPLIIMTIITAISVIALRYTKKRNRIFDSNNFILDIGKYVSIYHPDNLSNDFPSVHVNKCVVQYNSGQIDTWIRFTMGQLRTSELVDLGIVSSKEEGDIFGNIDDSEMDIYRDNGRLIGNISFNQEPVPKFKEILKVIGNKDGIVIYSNFTKNGSIAISNFLNLNNIRTKLFHPNLSVEKKDSILLDFKQHRIRAIVLDPIFTEGLSILGATQIHIMEPIQEKAKRDQVIGRVVRYRSHVHLPPYERHVEIYEWSCTAKSAVNFIARNISSLSSWFTDQSDVYTRINNTKFPQNITPDEIVLMRQDELSDFTQVIMDSIPSRSIDSLIPIDQTNDDCCVWNYGSDNQTLGCRDKPLCSDDEITGGKKTRKSRKKSNSKRKHKSKRKSKFRRRYQSKRK